MARVPRDPKIYHITHVDNLAEIVRAGCLWSDAKRIELGLGSTLVGMSNIKGRRLRLPVACHPGTAVGDYVPFYFCPRSIMLYILSMGNHPELSYRGGQRPIVHLVADLRATVAWAEAQGHRWALSDRNAGTRYARFFNGLRGLEEINWNAVGATDFRDPVIRDGKQAEFLVHEFFPWELVEEVGVIDASALRQVQAVLAASAHKHVLSQIEGHFISGYGDAEDDPEKQIELHAEAARQAALFLADYPDTGERFDRVVGLIEGFETPFGMELLSTVHWVATREGASTPNDAVAKTYAWNERKRMFQEEHIQIAWDVLHRKAWLPLV
ncbi:MAG: DUF4433 domain-containing protein [Planctomycetes bacterium]|nr:DUF4433 domain-containing protein [Planctomycetota bacterium]